MTNEQLMELFRMADVNQSGILTKSEYPLVMEFVLKKEIEYRKAATTSASSDQHKTVVAAVEGKNAKQTTDASGVILIWHTHF